MEATSCRTTDGGAAGELKAVCALYCVSGAESGQLPTSLVMLCFHVCSQLSGNDTSGAGGDAPAAHDPAGAALFFPALPALIWLDTN